MTLATGQARQEVRAIETDQELQTDLLALEVCLRAHEIWLARDGRNESDVADWLQAENVILHT